MKGTLCSFRLPAVIVLFLCTQPSPADAQQFLCWPIAPGDTASSLARRLTGSADAAYGLTFQIRDPARRMFVPKSHYRRLQPDWQACITPGSVPSRPVAYAPVVTVAPWAMPDVPVSASTPLALASAPLTRVRDDRTLSAVLWASTAGAAVLLVIMVSLVVGSLARRPATPLAVRRAGDAFVTAFARPLIDTSSGAPPIESRVRFVRRTQELEISIAPGPGRRYPNLADHKNNVDYDVARVLQALGNCVLCKPPRASGKWVVVTIRPRDIGPEPKEQGVS